MVKVPKPKRAESSVKTAKKATSGSFKPGASGNPGGRPKKTEEERTLEAMCKAKTPDALDTILQIMEGGQMERARLAAAQYVLDRAWGKPKESIEHSGTINWVEQLAAMSGAAKR